MSYGGPWIYWTITLQLVEIDGDGKLFLDACNKWWWDSIIQPVYVNVPLKSSSHTSEDGKVNNAYWRILSYVRYAYCRKKIPYTWSLAGVFFAEEVPKHLVSSILSHAKPCLTLPLRLQQRFWINQICVLVCFHLTETILGLFSIAFARASC